jgi:signal transduction histidine kinase
VAALVVVGAALAGWAVTRSITRPLSALTRQARDMAHRQLPTAVAEIVDAPLGADIALPHVPPVSVRTRDEIADVASALSSVQCSALDLALEQAILRRNISDSFVNLGRRNQRLLDRQVELITGLESEETDPDVLAALYRLDHLATRMRRNAESLLVLAGVDPSRRWARPVRMHDIVRAAQGEVEDYGRVMIRAVDPATVLGSAVSDVIHLLAELVENALTFSSPAQAVEVQGRARAGGEYAITVLDAGLGMLPEDVALANRRLAGAEAFTIAPSKYLGHYVVGSLAARHGIDVTLHGTAGYGVTAAVVLPTSILASGVAGQRVGSPG